MEFLGPGLAFACFVCFSIASQASKSSRSMRPSRVLQEPIFSDYLTGHGLFGFMMIPLMLGVNVFIGSFLA